MHNDGRTRVNQAPFVSPSFLGLTSPIPTPTPEGVHAGVSSSLVHIQDNGKTKAPEESNTTKELQYNMPVSSKLWSQQLHCTCQSASTNSYVSLRNCFTGSPPRKKIETSRREKKIRNRTNMMCVSPRSVTKLSDPPIHPKLVCGRLLHLQST